MINICLVFKNRIVCGLGISFSRGFLSCLLNVIVIDMYYDFLNLIYYQEVGYLFCYY